MANALYPPWKLRCHLCSWYILGHNRGERGNDLGAGVEAALLMQRHVQEKHPDIVVGSRNIASDASTKD